MEHEAPAASEVPQVLISTNEAAFVPPSAMELMVAAAVPVLLTVTTWAALVAAVTVAGKAIEAGVSFTTGAAAAAPVPIRVTVCGEPVALSAMDSEAVNAPAAAGLNSTETVQVAAAASDVPQVVADLRKDVAFVPVMVSDVSVKAAVPEFLTVTTCAAVVTPTVVDAKVRLVGVRVTAGPAAAVPVPVRATVCGDPVALSAIDSEAVSAPAAAGLNSTETVQVAATASDVPQVVADLRKDVAFVPVTVSDVSVRAAVPEFFTVTSCAAVVTPTAVEAKLRLVGVSVTAGAVTAAAHALTRLATLNEPRPVVRS